MKKRSEATQTLRGAKNFRPAADPLPGGGGRDGHNLISWRWSLPLPANPVWWRSMHAISSYRGNRPTNKQTNKQTHRQDRLQYTAPQLARSVTSDSKTEASTEIRVYVSALHTWRQNNAVTSAWRRFTEIKIMDGRSLRERCVAVDSVESFLFDLRHRITVQYSADDRLAAVVCRRQQVDSL